MKIKHLILAVTCLVSSHLLGQNTNVDLEKDYVPLRIYDSVPIPIVQYYEKEIERLKTKRKELRGKGAVELDINEAEIERAEYLLEQLKDRTFDYQGPAWNYLNGLLERVKKANNINLPTRLFVLRENSCNASSWGEGTILYHLGMLSMDENESQVISCLSHELAHYVLDHSGKKIRENAVLINSKNFKREVRKIKSKTYNKYSALQKLEERYYFSYAFHSRSLEAEADSLGYIFALNAKCDMVQYARSLEILDSFNSLKNSHNLDLASLLRYESIPINQDWFKYDLKNSLNVNVDDDYSDSLSTHPNCAQRKMAALEFNKKYKPTYVDNTDWNAFKKTVDMVDFEIIQNDYDNEMFSRGMFHTLYLLKKYPKNRFLLASMDMFWLYLYWHTKNHSQTLIVRFPNVRYTENYNRFLSFIQNLTLTDITKFKDVSNKEYIRLFGEDEHVKFYRGFDQLNAKKPFKEKQALYASLEKEIKDVRLTRRLKNELESFNPKNK